MRPPVDALTAPASSTGPAACDVTAATSRADPATVFRLVAELELWPALFHHVATARVLRRRGNRRLVEVRTSWHGVPLHLRAIQVVDRDAGTIRFMLLGRLWQGAAVRWTMRPAATGDGAEIAVQEWIHPCQRWAAAAFGVALLGRLVEIADGGSLAGPV